MCKENVCEKVPQGQCENVHQGQCENVPQGQCENVPQGHCEKKWHLKSPHASINNKTLTKYVHTFGKFKTYQYTDNKQYTNKWRNRFIDTSFIHTNTKPCR